MRKRKRKLSKHHIKNRCQGGDKRTANILMIYRDKHDIWHKLFGHLTLRQAAYLLLRLARMKERQA